MIPLVIAIVLFYMLIPVIKEMDMKHFFHLPTLFKRIRGVFQDRPDMETTEFQQELQYMSDALQEQRGMLAATEKESSTHEILRLSAEEARHSLVRLVRKYELDMTDDEYERVIQMLSSEQTPTVTSVRVHGKIPASQGSMQPAGIHG
jgi:hypothetical protein